jgi:hypothetical protein
MGGTVRVQTLPDGSTQWSVGAFVGTFRQLAPGAVYIGVAGASEVFVPGLSKAFDDEIERAGRITIFANLLEASRITGEARDGWANWMKSAKSRTSAVCLVKSKIVEMGVSLITLFSGSDVKSTSDVAAFEAAMRQAAPGARLPQIRKSA